MRSPPEGRDHPPGGRPGGPGAVAEHQGLTPVTVSPVSHVIRAALGKGRSRSERSSFKYFSLEVIIACCEFNILRARVPLKVFLILEQVFKV